MKYKYVKNVFVKLVFSLRVICLLIGAVTLILIFPISYYDKYVQETDSTCYLNELSKIPREIMGTQLEIEKIQSARENCNYPPYPLQGESKRVIFDFGFSPGIFLFFGLFALFTSPLLRFFQSWILWVFSIEN